MTITIRDNSYNRLVGTDDPDHSVWKSDSKSWKPLTGQELEVVSEPKTVEIYVNFCGIFTYQMIQVKDLDGVLRWVIYSCLENDGRWNYLYPEVRDQLTSKYPFRKQIKIVL